MIHLLWFARSGRDHGLFRPFLHPPTLPEIRDGQEKSYKQLGVKWWGGGTFIREENLGKDIGTNRLNQVSAGWIIYNRLFAFRGSFAIVSKDHDAGFVSGAFPTFKVKGDVIEPELVASYIVHCLNSPQYLQEVDRDSTGSTKTSRNR